jgi:putative transposase
MIPKVRKGGYIPFFVNAYKSSEAALVQVVQEACINGVSTRKIERLAKKLGIENISRSQVSEMTRGLNEQVDAFRNRSLEGKNIRSCGRMLSTRTFILTVASSISQ